MAYADGPLGRDAREHARAFRPTPSRLDATDDEVGQKFVDLELRLTPQPFGPGEVCLFWVEVERHTDGVRGTQLTDYETDIRSEDADERLVLILAPRQSLAGLIGVPETMPVVEWQALADAVRRWARRPELSAVDRFLLTDYLAY